MKALQPFRWLVRLFVALFAIQFAASQTRAAAAWPGIAYVYTDPSGIQIPFRFGVDTTKQYQLVFPVTVTTAQQNEVIALPQFNNYGYSGVYPTVSVGPVIPGGGSGQFIVADVPRGPGGFTITLAQEGYMFQVSPNVAGTAATLPSAAAAGDGWYCFIRDTGATTGVITTIPATTGSSLSVSQTGDVLLLWTDGTDWYSAPWFGQSDASGNLTIGPSITGTRTLKLNGGLVQLEDNTLTFADNPGTVITDNGSALNIIAYGSTFEVAAAGYYFQTAVPVYLAGNTLNFSGGSYLYDDGSGNLVIPASVFANGDIYFDPAENCGIADDGTDVSIFSNTGNVTLSATTYVALLGNNTVQINQPIIVQSTVNLNDGHGSSVGTLTNAPAAGNPTKWVEINDNGTIRKIPAW